jgi:hypothetical protein
MEPLFMAPFALTFEATPRSRVAENRPSAHDRTSNRMAPSDFMVTRKDAATRASSGRAEIRYV